MFAHELGDLVIAGVVLVGTFFLAAKICETWRAVPQWLAFIASLLILGFFASFIY